MKMRTSTHLYLSLAAALGVSTHPTEPSCAASTNLSVRTQGGQVNGFIDPSTPGVRRFLRIPYAQPPVGALRFAPPEPALPFGEISATALGPSCLQYLMTYPPTIYTQIVNQFNIQGLNETSKDVSEDCLTLSVWAPMTSCQQDGARLPVFMFIFGGAFFEGGENVPYQIPAKWVQRTQDHIVVTFNYRLGIFGFPNAAGIPQDEQNAGLLDQRLAVEWVRDNIAGFGGDPDRITLWGQSAGAVSAGYYQYAYPNDPIVTGIIHDSGSETLAAGQFSSSDTTHSNFSTVAAAVGCGGLSPSAQLACMRSDRAEGAELVNVIQTNNEDFKKPILMFTPVADNRLVFTDYTARSKAGLIAKIPAIIGSNVNDGGAFVPLLPGPQGFYVNDTLAQGATLAFFFCPATLGATDRVAAGLPVYRYLYAGDFSNISPASFLGAYHEAELPLIFGTDEDFRESSTELEKETSHAMQDSWVDFARAGAQGLDEIGWPRYTGIGGSIRVFGDGVPVKDTTLGNLEAMCGAFRGMVV